MGVNRETVGIYIRAAKPAIATTSAEMTVEAKPAIAITGSLSGRVSLCREHLPNDQRSRYGWIVSEAHLPGSVG